MYIPANIQQVVIDLPAGVHGFTAYVAEDDFYNIYLNAHDSHEQNVKTFEHEIGHIIHNDFQKYDINEIESEAHNRD